MGADVNVPKHTDEEIEQAAARFEESGLPVSDRAGSLGNRAQIRDVLEIGGVK
jgi:hypothetical protein